ncbi:MAG: hypothetical protein U9O95_03490 [Candidatus Marinimicrobia bacterium]|nr:hypothetical protein [Candidatus Neomarinimicrobiota bacterium]
MKKLIVFLMMVLMINSAFATGSIAYKAKLEAPKTMIISGGTSVSFTSLQVDFTYGFNRSNLHAKLNLQGGFLYLEGFMQHYISEVQTIDLGFSYGGRMRIGSTSFELSPVVLWNMSYQLAPNVAFYGGFKFNFDLGVTTGGVVYTDFDLNGYLGTQIDLINNFKLYVEVQPSIWSGVNNAYFGVNYYFPEKSTKAEMPDG